MLVADGVVDAGAAVGAAEPEDQVERKEESRPSCAEPTREERSNKLKTRSFNNDESLTQPFSVFS